MIDKYSIDIRQDRVDEAKLWEVKREKALGSSQECYGKGTELI